MFVVVPSVSSKLPEVDSPSVFVEKVPPRLSWAAEAEPARPPGTADGTASARGCMVEGAPAAGAGVS